MEQSDADRAAVAREVLTEYADILRDAGQTLSEAEVRRYVREHYPAPPAPETVTVGGAEWVRLPGNSGWGAADDDMQPNKADAQEFLDRIASDARVIRELERSRDGWDADARREAGNVLYWRGERDRAIEAIKERDARIAELEVELHETRERQLPMVRLRDEAYRQRDEARAERDAAWRALERERAANDTRIEYGTEPRGVVISGTLEEVKGEAGATVAASEPLASESPAATSPSPDPIPLGETVTVDGAKWARTELGWNGGAWRYHDSSTVARALTALYRARHPVATRETVERVRDAMKDDCLNGWDSMARAALTAAGFTIQEGA